MDAGRRVVGVAQAVARDPREACERVFERFDEWRDHRRPELAQPLIVEA